MHGPIGANVSKPLPRVYCTSFRCSSRAVTSLRHVSPSTYSSAVAGRHARRALANHDTELGLVIDPPRVRPEAESHRPGPMTAVDGFRNISGSAGSGFSISAA